MIAGPPAPAWDLKPPPLISVLSLPDLQGRRLPGGLGAGLHKEERGSRAPPKGIQGSPGGLTGTFGHAQGEKEGAEPNGSREQRRMPVL